MFYITITRTLQNSIGCLHISNEHRSHISGSEVERSYISDSKVQWCISATVEDGFLGWSASGPNTLKDQHLCAVAEHSHHSLHMLSPSTYRLKTFIK